MVALLFACAPGCAFAGRPPLLQPERADTVLERLPRGYASLEPLATAKPTSAPTLAQIRALLAMAARTGDSRLAARAEALLAKRPDASSPDVMKARAFAAQHRHDFAGALQLLDATLARDPQDADARLSRAQIRLVQGRLDLARLDCATLTLGLQVDAGALCLIALSMRRGDQAEAARLADMAIAQAGEDRELTRYLLATRAEIASRAGSPDADTWFRRALALVPDDVRTLAAYARFLRLHRRDAEALALLAHAPDTDGLQLQRTLAAHAVGAPDSARLVASQGRRYALAYAVGAQPEMRDEAEYLLTLRGEAPAALQLALLNFRQQRDVEDVDILQRAALAAGQPQALAGLRAWMHSQQLALPKPTVPRR
ncbi:MAG: hypothetical protein ACJ8GK_03305 [Luteimonas sp.]